jgi:hypothetical protein
MEEFAPLVLVTTTFMLESTVTEKLHPPEEPLALANDVHVTADPLLKTKNVAFELVFPLTSTALWILTFPTMQLVTPVLRLNVPLLATVGDDALDIR